MPIENERKYVLNPKSDEDECNRLADDALTIAQAYLFQESSDSKRVPTLRIRRLANRVGEVTHVLTVKQRVGDRTIEVETEISQDDYTELTKVAGEWVFKTRYTIGAWEVDFFKADNQTYFVMAEIELPDGVTEPNVLPDYIKQRHFYTVRHGDGRFSSKKLSQVDHACRLLALIAKEPLA